MTAKWEPWEVYKQDLPVLNIPGPPCGSCVYWRPQRQYLSTSHGLVYDGVRLCHKDDMAHDFSCFKPKEGA
jgi:hypothetical protein